MSKAQDLAKIRKTLAEKLRTRKENTWVGVIIGDVYKMEHGVAYESLRITDLDDELNDVLIKYLENKNDIQQT